jgi:hypothetical protein
LAKETTVALAGIQPVVVVVEAGALGVRVNHVLLLVFLVTVALV